MAKVMVGNPNLDNQNAAFKCPPKDPLGVRLISWTGTVAKLSLKNKTDYVLKISDIPYTATVAGVTISGTIPLQVTLKAQAEIELDVAVPATLPGAKIHIHLTITVEIGCETFTLEFDVHN